MTDDVLRADLLVAGGGPAGLAAAIAASQKGFTVIVADHANPPIDKACGEGLMPDGVAALNRLGVALETHQALPFSGIRFVAGQDSVATMFPCGMGWGIRRPVLHGLLVQRAARVGVSLFWGARLNWLNNGEVTLNGHRVDFRWILGADGHYSQARQWMKLDHPRFRRSRVGFRQHYRVAPWSDFVELHWGRNCQLVVTPVGHQEICLAVLSNQPQLRLEEALLQFPEVLKRLKGAITITDERGAISAVCSLRRVYRGRHALIGDASGSVDAITGKGLCLTFQQALFFAEALERGQLELYQTAHRRLARLPTLMSWLMLSMDRHAWLRERALRALIAEPPLFSRLLATHVGALPPLTFGFSDALKMGWRLVACFN